MDYKYKLMENFILLSTKNKNNIDQALANFSDMAGGENAVSDFMEFSCVLKNSECFSHTGSN